MALKAGNLIVFGTEARDNARKSKVISKQALEAGNDRAQLPDLSPTAQAEVDANFEARVEGLPEMVQHTKVLTALDDEATPLVRKMGEREKDDPDDPDFGKFTEIDEEGKDVIDLGTGKPKVIIDPAAL